ncbi:MAG: TPM domain-containing protein [candidate division WOR-3 bacterium]
MSILFFILSQTFPEPTGFLNDYAHILNQRQKEDLENHLREIENKTSVEIAIAIFDSIGYPIEEYANLLFEKWGIGKKGKDNGILILVSIKERLIRIEVGYGLEEVITDGIAGEIIRNNIVPYFREGDYYLGLKSAINEIEKRILKEDNKDNVKERGKGFLEFLILGLVIGSFLGYFSILLSIVFFILFLFTKFLVFLFISIGLFIGGLLLRVGGYYNGPVIFGPIEKPGGFGGFGGGLSGGGGATGRW